MQTQDASRLLSETQKHIKLIGATWQQLHGVVPQKLFELEQQITVIFPQLPSILSLRQTKGTNGREILVQGKPLSEYPPANQLKVCLSCGQEKQRTQRICTTCWQKLGKFQVEIQCPCCQEIFTVMSSRLAQRLSTDQKILCCSRTCAGQVKQILKPQVCLYCNKRFRPTSHTTQFCSRQCADLNHSKKMTGVDNPNYQHGGYIGDFKKLRKIVLNRDSFICVGCNTKEKKLSTKDGTVRTNLCVHHIDHDRSNNILCNLITLCRQCHVAHHQITDKTGRPSPFPELKKLAEERTLSMTLK